jgi:crotonobetainyl-CoA:carnitine CoA-transferase CaiB-like acyl-CoA transferase
VWAGTGCARYLADFGRDVVKVERPDGATPPAMGGGPRRRRRSGGSSRARQAHLVLDLKSADGLDAMRASRRADVLVENFRPAR